MDNKQMHKDVFRRKTHYIPLAVNVLTGSLPYTGYEALRDPQKAIANAEAQHGETRKVRSDILPWMESNFMECLVPSIFGAQTYESPGGLIDVKPIFGDIYETEKVEITDIFRGEMENAVRHLEYMRDHAPDWLYLNPTRPMSPLDYAVVMRGGEFYLDLAMEPELSMRFMEKITDVTIHTIKCFKEILGQPMDECVTVRGYCYPGIRLTGDAIVNLSPAMIEEMMCPLYKRFEEEFGAVMLHYCCLPAPSGHVIGGLAAGGGINCVDNWQGYQTLFNKESNVLQTDIGICTDVTKEQILSGSLVHDPFFTLEGRPLVCSTAVDTVEEGKRVYEKWQELWSNRRYEG